MLYLGRNNRVLVNHPDDSSSFKCKTNPGTTFSSSFYRRQAHASIINPDWNFQKMGIGGLDNEFSAIFRRAFASRVFPPEVIEQLGKSTRAVFVLQYVMFDQNMAR